MHTLQIFLNNVADDSMDSSATHDKSYWQCHQSNINDCNFAMSFYRLDAKTEKAKNQDIQQPAKKAEAAV